MLQHDSDADTVDQIRNGLRLQPDHQQRMLSKTFWAKFDIKSRRAARVDKIRQLLDQRNIEIQVNGDFGSESQREWLTLTLVDTEPWPDADWFDRMATREFESEAEVEYFFMLQLLQRLGYEEHDFSIQYQIEIKEGSKTRRPKVDIAVFEGHRRDETMLVAEVKHNSRLIDQDMCNQARSYAQWLNAPLYLVSNAEESRLYRLLYGAGESDLVLTFHRTNLKSDWPDLIRFLSRESVVLHKKRLKDSPIWYGLA